MARRPQTQNLPDAPAVQPAATPVSTFYAPNLPKPVLQTVIDLSPLSDTLAGILDKEERKMAEQAYQGKFGGGAEGARNATPDVVAQIADASKGLDDAEQKRKANQEAWAKYVAANKIPEWASPWARVGFMETSARAIVNQYARGLETRLGEVSTLVDPQTGLPKEPASADKVMAEEWAKYSGNAILQDYYGAKVSGELRDKINEAFQSRVAQQVGDEMVRVRKEGFQNEVAKTLQTWTASDKPPSPLDIEALNQFVQVDGRLKSIKDVRGSVLTAVEFAASSVGAADPTEGARLLRYARDLKVGNVTLGNDAEAGLKINKLIDFYTDEGDREADRKFAAEGRQLQHDLREAQKSWGPRLDELEQSGGNLMSLLQTVSAEVKGQPNAEFIVEDLRRNIVNRQSQPLEDAGLIGQLELQARRGQGIGPAIYAAIAHHSITASTGARLLAIEEQAANTAPLLAAAGFNSALDSLKSANRVTGLPAAVQGPRDAAFEDLLSGVENDIQQKAQELNGQPGAEGELRKFIQERTKAARTELNSSESDLRTKATAAKTEIEGSIASLQDATPLIKKYGDLLSDSERIYYTAKDKEARNYDRFYNTDVFQAGEREIAAGISNALEGDAEKLNSPKGLALRNDFERRYRSAVNTKIAELAKTVPPNVLDDAIRTAIPEISGEIYKQLSGVDVNQFSNSLKEGESAGQKLQAQAEYQTFKDGYTNTQKLSSKEFAQILPTNPLLDENALDLRRRFVSQDFAVSPFNTVLGTVSRRDLESSVTSETQRIMRTANLADKDKAQALVDLAGPVGRIRADDVLAGKMPVLSPQMRDYMEQHLTAESATSNYGFYAERILQASNWLEEQKGHTLPLKDVKFNPFTTPLFKDKADLDNWLANRTDDYKTLMKTLGIAKEDVGLFTNAQKLALDRTNHGE